MFLTSDLDSKELYPRSRTTISFDSLYQTTIVLLRVLHYETRSTILKMVFDFQAISFI